MPQVSISNAISLSLLTSAYLCDTIDVRYRLFRNDILNFRYLLDRLDTALDNASQRYRTRGPVLGTHIYDPLSDELETERKAIVGNFLATLQQCDQLLEKNKQFRQRSSSVVENIYFHLQQQEAPMEDLRKRLHFHSEKIRFVLDRLSINLLTDVDEKVDDILAITERNLFITEEIQLELNRLRTLLFGYIAGNSLPAITESEERHDVSNSIARRLEGHLQINMPAGEESRVTLPQWFDSLLLHFEQSNENTSDQTPEKYLVFLKARWLLRRLKQSECFRRARPGAYYKRAINRIEQAITAKIRNPGDLIPYEDSILLDLSDSCFHIWPLPTPTDSVKYSQPHPLMVRANEERISHIELALQGQAEADSVTIFKSSDETFRIVLQTSLASNPGDRVVIPQTVHVREDRLIPRWAFTTLREPSLEIAIFSRGEETLYNFGSFKDLCTFQAALMGYEVSHNEANIVCSFSKDVDLKDLVPGHCQLWQEPVVLTELTHSEGSASGTSLSRHDSLTLSMAPKSTINQTPDGWEGDSIKLPSVTLFSQTADRKRFAAVSAVLGPDVGVDFTKCKCHRNFNQCSRLVLVSRRKSRFPINILFSGTDRTGQPDPNSFDIFPLRNPGTKDSRNIITKETEFFQLTFATLPAKQHFLDELRLRFMVRDRQIQNRAEFERTMLYRQDRPIRSTPRSPTLKSSSPNAGPSSIYSAPSNTHSRRQSSIAGTISTVPTSLGEFDFEGSSTGNWKSEFVVAMQSSSPPSASGRELTALRENSMRDRSQESTPRVSTFEQSAVGAEVETARSKVSKWKTSILRQL